MKRLITVALTLLILTLSVRLAMAATPPDFPACSNPSGDLIVKHDTGVHGVAGDSNAYTGSDSVYTIDSEKTLQCFCSDSGNGIQTNWWKVSSLTQEEIDSLVKLGWVYVPDGSVWGLQAGAYLALNSTYACGNTGTGGGGGGSTQGSSTSNDPGIGQVLGLATTGSAAQIVLGLTLGSIFLGMFFILKRNHA